MLNEVTISTEEYRELIECQNGNYGYYNKNKSLQNENAKLKEEIFILKGIIMEKICDSYDLENGTLDQVMDPTSHYFPFRWKDLNDADISITDALKWITDKKIALEEQKEKEEKNNEDHNN